ncbi:MAG: hypothetical protein NC300_05585 [Bacteroidales bacterium]|nr:hypothetical protein [Clostridium sp.]MCM1203594.1 hypothetical protein [Bacteroidales bacterium]
MSVNISACAAGTSSVPSSTKTAASDKPVWNQSKAYQYLEDMNEAGLRYGRQAVGYYSAKISQSGQNGEISVDELKQQIKEWFPDYTLTDSEPKNVVSGKHYLYIDESQLRKMAADPAYRAKVYGLMDRELETGRGYTLKYSDGRNVTAHITGSIFSLSEKNRKYAGADGIPYRGSGQSDHPWSSSDSHAQVRSQSFLYNNLDPAKSAANERKTAAAAAAKKAAKKAAEKKAAKKASQEKLEEKRIERRKEEELRMEELRESIRDGKSGHYFDIQA